MYELKVEDSFSAAHNLRGYEGECEKLHGHNWKVEVTLRSEILNNLGMAIDFKELKSLVKGVLGELDHSYLNELPAFRKDNPTTENISRFLYEEFSKKIKGKEIKLCRVKVWESESSSAAFIVSP